MVENGSERPLELLSSIKIGFRLVVDDRPPSVVDRSLSGQYPHFNLNRPCKFILTELKCKLILRFLDFSSGKLSSNALFFIVRLLNKSIFERDNNTCGSVYHHFSKLEKHKIFITAAKMFKPMKTIRYDNSVWNENSIIVRVNSLRKSNKFF